MKYIIDIPEEIYKSAQIIKPKYDDVIQIPLEVIANGIPVEEFDNPCIYCGDNCCGAEYEDKRCECQKVFMIKENKQ